MSIAQGDLFNKTADGRQRMQRKITLGPVFEFREGKGQKCPQEV